MLITELKKKHRLREKKSEFPIIPFYKDKHSDVKFPTAPPWNFFNLTKKLEQSTALLHKPRKESTICVIGSIRPAKKWETLEALEVLVHATV